MKSLIYEPDFLQLGYGIRPASKHTKSKSKKPLFNQQKSLCHLQ